MHPWLPLNLLRCPAGFACLTLLPPQCWDDRHALPCLASPLPLLQLVSRPSTQPGRPASFYGTVPGRGRLVFGTYFSAGH